MSSVSSEQKQLLFDYCLGLTSEKDAVEAEALISSSKEAAEIHSEFKAALAPLDILEPDVCPDDLVERTVGRLNSLAASSRNRLGQLLATEQARRVAVKVGFWRNLGEVAAVAAAVAIIAAVLVPTFSFARHRYRRQRCQMQSASIFRGLSNYISDHDSRSPAVATAERAPWWKVGDQGRENQSNTRNIYLLVKGDYADLSDFVCPGSKGRGTFHVDPSQIQTYRDFPSRRSVTYSFQIRCRQTADGRLLCRKVLMADGNPLFEKLPEDFSKPLKLLLSKELLTRNSVNHNGRGQNVLFGDGRVEFLRTRHIGISKDDIFTLQDTDIYNGYEQPSCQTDFFLAP